MQIGQTPSGFLGLNTRDKKWDEGIEYFNFTPGKWTQVRFFGPIRMIAMSWLTSKNGKRFPLLSSSYDPTTRQFRAGLDPLVDEFDPFNSSSEMIKAIAPKEAALVFVIDRENQKYSVNNPAIKPWRPVRLSMALIIQLQRISEGHFIMHEGQNYGPFDVTNSDYGADIQVYYDAKNANPNAKYQLQKAGVTPLTAVEKEYLKELYDWEALIKYPSKEEVKKALQMNGYYQELNRLKGREVAGFNPHDSVLPPPPAASTFSFGALPPMPSVGAAFPNMQPMAPAPFQSAPTPFQAAPTPFQAAPTPFQAAPTPFQSAPTPFQAAPQSPPPPQPFQLPTSPFGDTTASRFAPPPPPPSSSLPPPAPQMITPGFGNPAPQMIQTHQQQPMTIQQSVAGFVNLPNQPVVAPVANEMPAPPMPGAMPMEFRGSPWPDAAKETAPTSVPPSPFLVSTPHLTAVKNAPELDIEIPFDVRAERKFKIVGRPELVDVEELQRIVTKFSATAPRAMPLKKWTTGNLEGLEVSACFALYVGDQHCVKCALRSDCLSAKMSKA